MLPLSCLQGGPHATVVHTFGMRMQEGPVHDVQWSPSGSHFLTVSGFMPARTNLFTEQCRMVHDLGAGPYNMARWNPQASCTAACMLYEQRPGIVEPQ